MMKKLAISWITGTIYIPSGRHREERHYGQKYNMANAPNVGLLAKPIKAYSPTLYLFLEESPGDKMKEIANDKKSIFRFYNRQIIT